VKVKPAGIEPKEVVVAGVVVAVGVVDKLPIKDINPAWSHSPSVCNVHAAETGAATKTETANIAEAIRLNFLFVFIFYFKFIVQTSQKTYILH